MADSKAIGISELSAAFRGLREDMQQRTAIRMVGGGARVVREEAKAIAAKNGLRRTGTLIRNIVMKRERGTPAETVVYDVGVRHGRGLAKKDKANTKLRVGRNGRVIKVYVDDPYYWRIAEFGTKHQPPTPFVGPALENKTDQVVAGMEQVLDRDLKKASKA